MFNVVKILQKFTINHGCRKLSASIDEFNKAQSKINKLKNDPGSEIKLKLYALFKQATEGQCTKPKPGMINFVDRAKWEAWTALSDMNKDKAIDTYIKVVEDLCKDQVVEESPSSNQETKSGVEGIQITKKNGVFLIRLNRVTKKNAITTEMYDYWAEMLGQADKDPSVNVAVVTGSGDYFCSGNDLSNFFKVEPGVSLQQRALNGGKVLQNFVGSFIDFSKPLIGLVNGPAIGISVTTLGLYDCVIASDNATFSTPFSNLGQTPEGCSSYTFPLIFGSMKANDMLMFNKTLSASEAMGLVTRVIPHTVYQEEAWKVVNEIASLPPQTLKYAKELIKGPIRKQLHDVNKNECNRLIERWVSDECAQAITKFFSRKTAAV